MLSFSRSGKNHHHFDDVLSDPECRRSHELFEQGLVYTHTFKYLHLLLHSKAEAAEGGLDGLGGSIEGGLGGLDGCSGHGSIEGGLSFLAVANAKPDRTANNRKCNWQAICDSAKKHLPEDYGFNVLDAQSTSCKMIQVLQSIFSVLLVV